MTQERAADLTDQAAARLPLPFTSLLEEGPAGEAVGPGADELDFISDLRLDQIIEAVAGQHDERGLIAGLLRRKVRDIGTAQFRQDVFRDLEDRVIFDAARAFVGQMREVRAHLAQLPKMRSRHQREGWFLDAAVIYCDAVRALATALSSRPVASRALTAFRDHLAAYLKSAGFARLAADTAERRKDLARVTYLVRIKGPKVEVSRYEGESDYSAEIEETFERFRQGAVKDYRITYRTWPGMGPAGTRILEMVARLYTAEFGALADYCRRHAGFVDPSIGQFGLEIQFYLSYLDYIAPLRREGLSFCLPELTADSKEVFARDTFDLALATRLTAGRTPVVANDFELRDRERIIVVSGPNQGGKTTFARTFGQLHHLAAAGCPVPGSAARLYVPDQIFTHFEREEDIATLTGKLEDDLLRIQKVLQQATPRSIVILNEIFTSTTLSDARFLGGKVLEKLVDLDGLGVYVTFIDELASFGDTVVSMVSTVVPGNPAQRTYKVVRQPADGLAYALAIADKHRVTYRQLRERIAS